MELAGVSLWGPGDKTERRLKVQKPATNKEEEEELFDDQIVEYPSKAPFFRQNFPRAPPLAFGSCKGVNLLD